MTAEVSLQWSYFSDRPVGLDGDLLWEGDVISEEIDAIAERIVAPLYREGPEYPGGLSDSMTFAIYGKWGMGKSSALRMLSEEACRIAKEHGVGDRLRFCTYQAPAHQAVRDHNARTTLSLRILTALAGSPEEAIRQFLDEARGVTDEPDRVLPPGAPSEAVSWMSRALSGVTEVLAGVVDFDKVVARGLTADGTGGAKSRVLLVLVDDLDRCTTDFVWQVLDAIQQLSTAQNLFFVLAVEREQLRKTVLEKLERAGGAANPDFALEKYVQHATWVPDMDEEHLQRFVTKLMERYDPQDAVTQVIVANVQFLQYGLRERTPRSIKRCLNTIRFELGRELEHTTEEREQQLALKARILEYVWPEFYRENLWAAKQQSEWGRQRRPYTALEQACADFARGENQDEAQLRFQIKRIAERFGLNWEQDPLPLDLIRYLGLEPYWFAAAPSQKMPTVYDLLSGVPIPKGPGPAASPDELRERFDVLYYQEEAEEASGNRSEALRLAEELYELVSDNRKNFGPRECPLVGNAAVTAENFKANALAARLYQLAIVLDPEHSNNLQNFVDFVVKVPMPELYAQALQCVAKLKTGKHTGHQPERTTGLEARLNMLMGQEEQVVEQAIEGMVAAFEQSPADMRAYVNLMTVLDQVGDFDTARKVTRLLYNRAETSAPRYTALRGLGDTLAASTSSENELEAMEIYRYLTSSALFQGTESDSQRADLCHNFATLLYKHDYDDEAGRLWFEAYRRQPKDSSIRQSYAGYLSRASRPDLARLVSAGKVLPVGEPVLQAKVKELPTRFVGEHVECWWEM